MLDLLGISSEDVKVSNNFHVGKSYYVLWEQLFNASVNLLKTRLVCTQQRNMSAFQRPILLSHYTTFSNIICFLGNVVIIAEFAYKALDPRQKNFLRS